MVDLVSLLVEEQGKWGSSNGYKSGIRILLSGGE
jgi:hypothetical protein